MAPSPGRLGLLLLWHWCCGVGATWLPAEPPWHPPDIRPEDQHKPSLPSIGRRRRRQLTNILVVAWSARHPGHLLRKPRLRRRWGLRGVRVGEAAHPGPAAPGTPLHPAIQRYRSCTQDEPRASRRRVAEPAAPVRCFCPVPGCGHGDAARASGWGSHDAMLHHLDDHCSGTLAGAVPMDYLQAHGLDLCSVCGLLVARRYNGTHPRCRPQSRQQAARRGDSSVADPGLPTLDGIMACEVSTARHVPHVARATWAQCLARALATAASSNTMTAWQELLMLPKAVLVAPSRAGARHQRQAALATLRRCQRWLAGERMELWEELRARTDRAPRLDTAKQTAARQSRCCALAAEGELSRACAALVDAPPLPASSAVLEQLVAQHPQAPPPDLGQLGPARPAAVPELSHDAITKAIRSFARASAPGPSGLRADHLKDTLSTAHGDEVIAHLVVLCQLLANGEAPAAVAPHLAGARLHALPKKSGGVRPIAVGETLRRLVSKVLCQSVRTDAAQFFWPLQVGVGVSMGGEAAIHTVRQWIERNSQSSGKVLLKVDFRNAFNSVTRHAFLAETRDSFPGLACWVDWCYGAASVLRFGKHIIPSSQGIQQGDPLGPLLFSTAFSQPFGKLPSVRLSFAFRTWMMPSLQGRLTPLQPPFEFSKPKLRPPAWCWSLPSVSVLVAGDASTVDLSTFPASFSVKRKAAFELLGSPVGDTEHCNAVTLTERVGKAAACLEALGALDDPQVSLMLLRHCSSFTKLVHSMRTTPAALHHSALQVFYTWCKAGWLGLAPMCSSRPCCLLGFGGCHSRGLSWAGRQIHPRLAKLKPQRRLLQRRRARRRPLARGPRSPPTRLVCRH